ncbi:alpha/beta fold hydrolase [Salinisphaera sp.]|uniref:alpha/beta fold hydrolase n=1 Tax=Salinisphaera sp. TaxID=1914330 RepID=UPI002D7711C7|nr:alpha/beta fold hydrolase [Salinisphaera sp.]HET7313638.1 alpha/beta fold hydrolase [Salinisphaera sp.]
MNIIANGLTLHADESGRGPLTLVFLHYWGGTARTWHPVMAALPENLRKISLDARGWGQSDRPEDGYDIATMADDVEAAIAALGLERYVLVGHSMGGKVAQLLASRRPSGLVGLVLVAPSPAEGKSLPEPEREDMAGAYAVPESVGWTIDNVLTERPLSPTLRDQVIADSLGGAEAAKKFWPYTAISEDVSADLARIDVSVWVIGGQQDKVDGVDMLRRVVLPSLPGAVMRSVPGVGHLIPLEAPQAVAASIVEFVDAELSSECRTAKQPEDVPAIFDSALNRGDLDAVMSLFHPEAIMRMQDGKTIAEGRDALRGAFAQLIPAQPEIRNGVRRVIASGDIALLLLEWTIRLTPPGQDELVERGVATQVVERNADGIWQLRISNPLGID